MADEAYCPLCEGCVAEPFVESACWNYVQCTSCGAVFLRPSPSPEELRTYYNQSYMVPMEAYAQGTRRNAPPLLRKLAQKFPAKGKLLEIGSSYGFFLEAARREGWDVAGIELDDQTSRYGRDRLGLKIFSGTLESEISRLEPPYDVIASFHVIEHVADPIRFLERCQELLTGKGGTLVLKTPNVASWIAKKTGSSWQWLSAPAHIHLFSPGTLELALRKSGFRVERIWSRRGDAHNNLFELVCGAGRYMASRKRGLVENHGRRTWSDRWQVNVAKAVSEAVYYPLGLMVDPWLGGQGLQPELVAIADVRE